MSEPSAEDLLNQIFELTEQVDKLTNQLEDLHDRHDDLLAKAAENEVKYEMMASLLESLEGFADWQSPGYAASWKEEASQAVGLALWEAVSDNFARAQGYRLAVPATLQRARS